VADAPWRCTQCGTVNEPDANACRSCGRWPSLFDLERSTIDVEEAEVERAFEHPAPVPEAYEVPVEAPEPVEADYSEVPTEPAEWPGPEDPLNRPMQGWPQRLGSLIVPIAFLVYVLISILTNR
jgi:hypothetical protein